MSGEAQGPAPEGAPEEGTAPEGAPGEGTARADGAPGEEGAPEGAPGEAGAARPEPRPIGAPREPPSHGWPRPPSAIPASWLSAPPSGARVCVAGLVLVRQRPGTAHGTIFVTLEDETGTINVIVWRRVYERDRRAVIAGRMLRVLGRLQREGGVTHVIAERVQDISEVLDALIRPRGCRAAYQPHPGRP